MFQHTVNFPNAPWLRLHFEDYDLGRGSHVIITSLEDGAWQRLDARSMPEWNGSSAYFNGDGVELALYVAPGDKNVFFRLAEVQVGEREDVVENASSVLCHNVDDRVSSSDPAVGRHTISSNLDSTGTQWRISNGAYLAAGHTFGGVDIIQFNVPASSDSGTVNHPPPEDQYPTNRLAFADDGSGNDWQISKVGRNSNTGLLPVEAYGGFYCMIQGGEHDTFRVTGYGIDEIPAGSTGGRNSDSSTQQTHAGTVVEEDIEGPNRAKWIFHGHVEGGSSGSPIIVEGTTLTTGIVTHCVSGDLVWGTSFSNQALENAIQTFPGPNVTYVDNGHPASQEDGGVFNPFDSVGEGVNAVTAGGILSIVAGTYPETLTINKAMRIEAPVGTVRIDPNAPPSLVARPGEPRANAIGREQTRDVPEEFSLAQNHPNPVSSETQIAFALPEATYVSLVLYDVLGREVARLVGHAMETGNHTVDFNASSLPAGIYVYRIQAEDFVESRRMLVVK